MNHSPAVVVPGPVAAVAVIDLTGIHPDHHAAAIDELTWCPPGAPVTIRVGYLEPTPALHGRLTTHARSGGLRLTVEGAPGVAHRWATEPQAPTSDPRPHRTRVRHLQPIGGPTP